MSGEVPEGWSYRRLGDVVKIVNDGISADAIADLSAVAHYSLPAFDEGQAPEITAGLNIKSNKSLVPSNCVLFSKLNPRIPRVWRVAERSKLPSVCSTEFWPLVARSDETDLDFFAAVVGSEAFLSDPQITPSSSTNSHQRVDRRSFENYVLSLPPLDEQRRIADVLRSVGETISAAEGCVARAKSTLNALLSAYFCGSGEATDRNDLKPLCDLVSIQSGFAFKSEDYQYSGHFLMRIGNVQDGHISSENPKFVHLDKKTRYFELRSGDILTSLTGNIGRVARIHDFHLPAALNQRVARVTPNPNAHVDADYLFFALKSPLFKAGLAGESGGAAQQNVSPKAIGRVEIPLPSMAEQVSIGKTLLAIDEVVNHSSAELEQLKKVKSFIMSDLLSGRVRVPA
jgi:hypothetical protein